MSKDNHMHNIMQHLFKSVAGSRVPHPAVRLWIPHSRQRRLDHRWCGITSTGCVPSGRITSSHQLRHPRDCNQRCWILPERVQHPDRTPSARLFWAQSRRVGQFGSTFCRSARGCSDRRIRTRHFLNGHHFTFEASQTFDLTKQNFTRYHSKLFNIYFDIEHFC